MGCSFSRLTGRRDADTNPRVFKVFNVDDQGLELNPGKIEISDTHLILYQKSKEPIGWPLRSLRRYGFDAELFSFESGRRCPTGPGIYAFKCRRAEALFNLLQECIQKAGQEDQQQRSTIMDGSSSRPNSIVEMQQANGSLRSNTMPFHSPHPVHSPHHYVNGYMATSENGGSQAHEYVNTEIAVGAVGPSSTRGSRQSLDIGSVQVSVRKISPSHSEGHVINYAELYLQPSEDAGAVGLGAAGGTSARVSVVELDPTSSHATYINVPVPQQEVSAPKLQRTSNGASVIASGGGGATVNGSGTSGVRKVLMKQSSKEDQHNYANLDLLSTGTTPKVHRDHWGSKVANIQIDSNKENFFNGPNPPASPISLTASIPDSPSRRTESYAQIDFHKTAALVKGTNNEDEGSRKTRHNSNIDELT